MKLIATVFTITLLVVSLSGCATLVSKSKYPVTINSTPDGTNITIVDRSDQTIFIGKTPTTVTLKAGHEFFQKATYRITFDKDGYTKQIVGIEGELDNWYIGNFCVGGVGFNSYRSPVRIDVEIGRERASHA